VLIAPAPDFTEELMWKGFSPEVKQEIETKGVCCGHRNMANPIPITRALIEEGRNHLLLGRAIEVGCPVRILQARRTRTCRGNMPSRWRTGCPATTWC